MAGGFLVVFFGGTWESIRIELEILGAIWLLQTSSSVLIEDRKEREQKEYLKKITDQYFKVIKVRRRVKTSELSFPLGSRIFFY